MKVKEFTLNNGLKVIITNTPDSEMVSSNLFIGVGSRYEVPTMYGISHFLEHIAFKGTKSFPTPKEFTAAIESIGGAQNAWTSEDHTMYWNMVPKKYLPLALKSLSEQVSALILDEHEIDKERGTIIEEIKRKNDDPYQLIGSHLNKILWPHHPLECDVLGEIENIKKITKRDFKKYISKYYAPNNMVLSIAGNLNGQVLDLLEESFGALKKVSVPPPKKVNIKQKKSHIELITKKLEQGHLILAYHTFGYNGKQRYALEVLMAILAGGMSSLLFVEIREKRGLAYAIEGGVHFFGDCGFTYIYGGFNKNKIEEALTAIHDINQQAKKELFDDRTIKKAKEYLKGNLLMKIDGIRNTSTVLGQKKLLDPREIDYRSIMRNIDKTTAEEIKKVALDIFRPEKENLIVLGPYKSKEKFAKILNQN